MKVQAQDIPQAVNGVTASGLSLTWLSAGWAWMGNNSDQITVIFGFIGLCITAYGVLRRRK